MTATIDIVRVSHRYGNTQALTDINLNFEAGSFVVLLGPSGCGKTTLLSVLGGFVTPTEGSVFLNGVDITHQPPAKRATTTMFQDYALFPHMTLIDNVGFGLRMRGQSKKQRNQRAAQLLDLVGLEASAKKKPHELSGGQRQRVALARALAVEPQVLLLDEPLGALDLKLRRQMQVELKAIQKRVGTSFIHVTHDQEEAMAIADQIIVMNAGKVEDSGTPESIYLNPGSAFSAAFMGEANLVDCTLKTVRSGVVEVTSFFGVTELAAPPWIESTNSTEVPALLCIRPEHLMESAATEDAFINLGSATVVNHAFFGAYQRCEVSTESGRTFVLHLPQLSDVDIGAELSLSVPVKSIVLLPPG
jgi:spermidine/putrescine transport system ATP-binding protein